MENSYTKYLELVEQGKIDPNEPTKRIFTESEVRQISYEVGLWAIDIERIKQMKKPSENEFKDKFDKWIKNRMKL